MDYINLLDPKNFSSKFLDWAKRGNFDYDDENNRVTFGDDNVEFGAGSEGGTHHFGATIGGREFKIGFGEGGFQFDTPWN